MIDQVKTQGKCWEPLLVTLNNTHIMRARVLRDLKVQKQIAVEKIYSRFTYKVGAIGLARGY